MKKKVLTLFCMTAAFSMMGCSGKTKNEDANVPVASMAETNQDFKGRGNFPPGTFNNMQFGKILEVNGNEITVALAEMPERMERPDGDKRPERGELPEGGKMPEGFEMPENGKMPEGFEMPEGMEAPDGMPVPNGAGMPGNQLNFSDETMVLTLSEQVEISAMNGKTYGVGDLTADMVITYSLGEEQQVLTIQIMQAE